jgi:KinB signaling pathway activation protein
MELNSRKLVGLFFKTLFVGGLVALVVSFFVGADKYMEALQPFDLFNLLGIVAWYVLYGLLFSVISQAGFFSYLFINQFGLGLFRSFWPTVQIVLIAFTLFDLVYFPYRGTNGEIAIYLLVLMVLGILMYGMFIAWIKAKETQPRAFMPALFFMIVLTAIEWIPGLRTGEVDYALLMIITLLACNTYQLLILHRLTGTAKNQTSIHGPGKQESSKSKK